MNLSEADTKAYLIDPMLPILGYQGVSDLRREVRVRITKEFLDYELLVDGKAQAIVEPKALRHPLIHQHAAQCVEYASVLGVRWCFITNGVQWALYDAHAKVPLAEKRVAEVRLDGDERSLRRAWEVLSLFRRDAIATPSPLAALLVERVLVDELARPNSPAVEAIRKSVLRRFGERVPGRAVVAAFEQLVTGGEGERPGSAPVTITRRRAPKGVSLADLVGAGLLPPDAVLEAKVAGVSHVARMKDHQIEINGVLHATPSAASMALRQVPAWNGWIDWLYQGETLASLRRRLQIDRGSRSREA